MKRKCLKDVRDIFSERLYMLPFAANYSHDKRFAANGGVCPGCDGEEDGTVVDDQDHVASSCPGYADLRADHDMDTDQGLVRFYRAVLDRRKEEEECSN